MAAVASRGRWLTALVALTAFSGAFVAGNGAGFAYNTWWAS